jgi:hypothetical protein
VSALLPNQSRQHIHFLFDQVQVSNSFIFNEWMLDQAISLPSTIFARLLMFVWSLWKNRNDKMWNDSEKLASVLTSIYMAWYEEFLQGNQSPAGTSNTQVQIVKHWSPPSMTSLKQC